MEKGLHVSACAETLHAQVTRAEEAPRSDPSRQFCKHVIVQDPPEGACRLAIGAARNEHYGSQMTMAHCHCYPRNHAAPLHGLPVDGMLTLTNWCRRRM